MAAARLPVRPFPFSQYLRQSPHKIRSIHDTTCEWHTKFEIEVIETRGSIRSFGPWYVASIEAPFRSPFPLRPLQSTFPPSPIPFWRWCLVNVVVSQRRHSSTSAPFPHSVRDIRVKVISKRSDPSRVVRAILLVADFRTLGLNSEHIHFTLSLERFRKLESYPHPTIKVIKPDWGHSTLPTARCFF